MTAAFQVGYNGPASFVSRLVQHLEEENLEVVWDPPEEQRDAAGLQPTVEVVIEVLATLGGTAAGLREIRSATESAVEKFRSWRTDKGQPTPEVHIVQVSLSGGGRIRSNAQVKRIEGPTLSLAEAARRSDVSESTIRRRLQKGDIDGARREDPDDDSSPWVIPIAGLVTAGLMEGATAPDEPTPPPAPEPMMVNPARDDVAELERALAEERQARAVAEALAAERERLIDSERRRADELAKALEAMSRALPAAPAEPSVTAPESVSAVDASVELAKARAELEAERQRPWWRRRNR